MGSHNSPKLKVSVLTFIISTGIFALAMFLSESVFGAMYGSPKMMLIMLPSELTVIALLSFIVTRYFTWKEAGICFTLSAELLWLIPAYLMLITGWTALLLNIPKLTVNSEQWKNFILYGIVTMTVGITEELLFRGIILSSLTERMSARKAVLFSALLFSLFHSINVISGLTLPMIIFQLVSAFVAGFYLASVRLKINSILPLIIWHWLWDFFSLGSGVISYKIPQFMTLLIVVELITGLIIWVNLKNILKKD